MATEIGTTARGALPSAIRAACRAEVLASLPEIVAILRDPFARDGDRIKAWSELAKVGIGAADSAHIHITAESGSTLGIVHLPQMAEPHVPLGLSEPEEG